MSGSSIPAETAPHIQLQSQPSNRTSMASPQTQPMQLGVTPSAPLVESSFVTMPRSQPLPESVHSSQQLLLPADSFMNLNAPPLTPQTASPIQQLSAPILQAPALSGVSQVQTTPGAPPGKHYPMFFSPETGKILMNIEGYYHVVPHPINDMSLQSDRPLIHVSDISLYLLCFFSHIAISVDAQRCVLIVHCITISQLVLIFCDDVLLSVLSYVLTLILIEIYFLQAAGVPSGKTPS